MTVKTVFQVGVSVLRNLKLKILRGKKYRCHMLYSLPLRTKIIIDKGAKVEIGKRLSGNDALKIAVRPNAELKIGDRVNFNSNCFVVCRDRIEIGNDVIFGPGCKIYDHDHNYKKRGVERVKSFVTDKIIIGNGCWFGADCVILRGTTIGDNCVFGAGSIIKGEYPSDVVVTQRADERRTEIKYADTEK